ncbi:hypothetical protein [Mesorhizobium sp.]|uniref:hypothetical protein n=1 Tax=Mesorhizobium sp. TaxID=1871066 RepID=UPI0025F95FCD|nr:hypothetical protein [Mesorhizobium sp.]
MGNVCARSLRRAEKGQEFSVEPALAAERAPSSVIHFRFRRSLPASRRCGLLGCRLDQFSLCDGGADAGAGVDFTAAFRQQERRAVTASCRVIEGNVTSA